MYSTCFVSGFNFFLARGLGVKVKGRVDVRVKMDVHIYLATHNCHMCSTFHCDKYLWRELSEVLIMKSEANIL